MVYNDVDDLGWWPYVESWLAKKDNKTLVDETRRLINKYMKDLLEYIRLNCFTLLSLSVTNTVISFCTLYDSLTGSDVSVNQISFIINIICNIN